MTTTASAPSFAIQDKDGRYFSNSSDAAPELVLGVTHPQTCLILRGRLRALREAGFHVTLVSSPGELLYGIADSEGVDAVPIDIEREISPLQDVWALVQMVRLLRRIRPAVVEFSTPKMGLIGTLAAWFCKVPRRVYLLRGLKLETSFGWKRKILLAAEKLASACADVVLCNSNSLRNEAMALGLAREEKLLLLGAGSSNGVDTHRFSPGPSEVRERLGIPPVAPVIGFVGRLTRDKGLVELLDAFPSILEARPSVKLLLVGWFDEAEDALDAEVKALIEVHPRIFSTGFVADTAPYYRAMDLLVLPTWREGFPNAILEAAACGVPAITTFATGSRDAVVPEETGLLIAPGSPEAIVESALRLLNDPMERMRMGEAAMVRARREFSNEHVLGLTVDLYRDLARKAGAFREVPVG